jgi:hypothetical protein
MRVKRIFFIIASTALVYGCRKSDLTPDPPLATDVYAVGTVYNWNNSSIPTIWKNGVPSSLTSGVTLAGAWSIFVSGPDVYAAGYENDGNTNRARIWKNGAGAYLPGVGYNATSRANAIYVSGTDVYAIGEVSTLNFLSAAILWKNGVATLLSDTSGYSMARSVFVSGTDVYVAGDMNNVATLWKNGVPLQLNSSGTTGGAQWVTVSGTDVYVAGYEIPTPGDIPKLKIWKNGVGTFLTNGTYHAYVNSVYVSGTDVYAGGTVEINGKTVATIWKNGAATYLTNITSNMASVFSVYVSGTDVYAAGLEYEGAKCVGRLWKNGVSIPLPSNTNNSRLDGLFVK